MSDQWICLSTSCQLTRDISRKTEFVVLWLHDQKKRCVKEKETMLGVVKIRRQKLDGCSEINDTGKRDITARGWSG